MGDNSTSTHIPSPIPQLTYRPVIKRHPVSNTTLHNVDVSKFSANLLPLILGFSYFTREEVNVNIYYKDYTTKTETVKVSDLCKLANDPQIYRIVC